MSSAGSTPPLTPPKPPRPEPVPFARSRAIDALAEQLTAIRADESDPVRRARALEATVAAFWEAHPSSPMVESIPGRPGLRIVTFLWRDAEAEEVLLFANRITDERDLRASLMQRIPGTDIWHHSYQMRSDWRASYAFLPRRRGEEWPWGSEDQVAIRDGLDRALPDPRNPERQRNRAGFEHSIVALPQAPAEPWLRPRQQLPARGRIVEHRGPGGRVFRVYEPPALADDPEGPRSLVVALDGEVWTGVQNLPTTIDNLVHDRLIRPPLVVLPDAGGRERRWAELGGAGASRWIVDDVLPWMHERYEVSADPSDVVVAGQSLGALTALQTALEHPDLVGGALSQSASLWQRRLEDLLEELHGRHELRIYMEVGIQEWVLREPNARLAERLRAEGITVDYREYNGGHDYACWRGGYAYGLQSLLGL